MKSLANRRILVVEDDVLIAMQVEELLADEGCTVVGPVGSVARAMAQIAQHVVDAAVLDVNLGREKVFPVADTLAQANIPFVLVTGHTRDWLPEAHRDRPIIFKPYHPPELINWLLRLFAR